LIEIEEINKLNLFYYCGSLFIVKIGTKLAWLSDCLASLSNIQLRPGSQLPRLSLVNSISAAVSVLTLALGGCRFCTLESGL